MRRRNFLAIMGGAAAGWPLVARAQQPLAIPIVGFLHSGAASSNGHVAGAFRQGLAESGYVEGHNATVEYRWAEGQYDRLPALADELVRRPAAVILAGAPPAARAVKAATPKTPIIFVTGDDPTTSGLVERLNHPGGNITGVSLFSGSQLGAKHVELLHELLPHAAQISLLVNPINATQTEAQTRQAEDAARQLGLGLYVLNASTESDLAKAFSSLAEQRAAGLIVGGDPFFTSQRSRLVTLAAQHKLPAIYNLREFVLAGGLMSYGNSITDAYYQAGIYVGKILKGAAPADLPVLQPTKFELVINRRTAEMLRLDVSPILLTRADEVIE